jgi:hypothetical protein
MDELYDTAVKKAFFDREQVRSILKQEVEIEFRFKLPFIPNSLIRNIRPSYYTEKRYLHPEYPHVKLRVRNGGTMISKSNVSRYSLEPHWCSLCVSTESTYISYELHRLFYINEIRVEYYAIPIRDLAIMDIKKGRGLNSVEVEFLQYTEEAKAIVKKVVKTILNETIKPYMDRTVFELTTIPFNINDYPKPKTLQYSQIKTVLTTSFYVTIKNDGERTILLIRSNGTIYEATARKPYFYPISHRKDWNKGTMIVDCERVNNTYYLLDYDDYSNAPFEERVKHFHDILPMLKTKEYRRVNNIIDVVNYWNMEDHPKNDGLLLIDGTQSYKKSCIYKWKHKNTIDLLAKDGKLYCHDHVEFDLLPCVENVEMDENVIYEFLIDHLKSCIIPMRKRDDKIYPNSFYVVKSNIYNSITLDNIQQVGCKAMREYHNTVKQECIDQLTSNVLIDIGTGQGADILKWHDKQEVYCIEHNEHQLDELIRRIRVHKRENIHIISKKISSSSFEMFRSMTVDVTTFFCLNLFKDEDFEALSILFQTANINRWAVIFMDHNKIIDIFGNHGYTCSDFTLNIYEQYTYINIPKSRVLDLIEFPLTIDDIIMKFPMMSLESSTDLTSPLLFGNQAKLSQCYTLAIFHPK